MQTREVILENPHGLHMRVASEIVALVKKHGAKVSLSCRGCRHADGCSILQLLLLDATQGVPIHIEVDGPHEEQVVSSLCDLFADGSGI